MTVLIGLNGRRGAGKDTAYSFIHQWGEGRGVSVGRRGFADALKLSFARLFIPNVSVDEAVIWCDMLKGEGQSKVEIEWGNYDHPSIQSFVKHVISGRVALQRYGTEGHRDVFGEDFWVDALLPLNTVAFENVGMFPHKPPDAKIDMQWPRNFMGQLDQEPPQICVITDCRFPNEAQRIKILGGQVWEIHRGGQKIDDGHSSEKPLPPNMIDTTVYNNAEGDFRAFKADIEARLEALEL